MSLTSLALSLAAPLPRIEQYERYLFLGPHPDDIEIGAGVVKVIATSGGGYGAESIKGKYVTIADPSKVTQN